MDADVDEQRFNKVFGVSSKRLLGSQAAKLRVEKRRWKAYLAKKPEDAAAKAELQRLEVGLKDLKRCTENTCSLKDVRKLSFIESVVVSDGKVVLETVNIKFKWKEQLVGLGNYLITFTGNGKLPKIKRKQGKAAGVYHTHVGSLYGVCWTHSKKTKQLLNDALRDKRPDVIATIAFEMLRKPDEGSGLVSCSKFIYGVQHDKKEEISEVDIDWERFCAWIERVRWRFRILPRLRHLQTA